MQGETEYDKAKNVKGRLKALHSHIVVLVGLCFRL